MLWGQILLFYFLLFLRKSRAFPPLCFFGVECRGGGFKRSKALALTNSSFIERCWEEYINTNICQAVDQMTRYNSRLENGLGMLRISDFRQSVKLSWLRRLPYTQATWGKLHREETGNLTFCLINSNLESLEAARKRMAPRNFQHRPRVS